MSVSAPSGARSLRRIWCPPFVRRTRTPCMYELAFPEAGWSGNRVGSKTSFCARFGVRLTDPDHGVAKLQSALLRTLEFARQRAFGFSSGSVATDVIAFGALKRTRFKTRAIRRDAREHRANAAA